MQEGVRGETGTGRRHLSPLCLFNRSGRRLTGGNEHFNLYVPSSVRCFSPPCTGAHTCSRQASISPSSRGLPAPGVPPKVTGRPVRFSALPLDKRRFGRVSVLSDAG